MMTEKRELFKCGTCGAFYLTEEEARVCEGTHANILKISAAEYLDKKEGDSRYAERIYIQYSDGHVIQYEATKTGIKNFIG